jgi:hypothetical protein
LPFECLQAIADIEGEDVANELFDVHRPQEELLGEEIE